LGERPEFELPSDLRCGHYGVFETVLAGMAIRLSSRPYGVQQSHDSVAQLVEIAWDSGAIRVRGTGAGSTIDSGSELRLTDPVAGKGIVEDLPTLDRIDGSDSRRVSTVTPM